MEPAFRPKLTLIADSFVNRIIDEAFSILNDVGVFIENRDAYRLLSDHGAQQLHPADAIKSTGRLFFPRDLVEKALKTIPKTISLWDITGEQKVDLGGDQVHFDPGSAALFISDPIEKRLRKPITRDLQRYIHMVDRLPHFHLQSTALVSSDVPDSCGDSYRLYLALKFGRKPVVTGIFKKESFAFMQQMLELMRGSSPQLREQPLAIFDACPSPPLMWSDLTAHSVIAAAKAGIPSEFVSMPLTGSTSPVTLSGAIVQHAVETLSGVVLAQCATPGAPVVWGGSPAAMDLRFGTTPMGAIETMMIDLADVAVGKALGLPTHAYMGLSDSKRVDYQAGSESGLGIILAALAGINVISGPGMMDFESCQSLEKLVLDHEVCGMAYRLLEGVSQRDELMALNLLKNLPEGGHFLTDPHTLKWFKEELHFPGKSIDRRARGAEAFTDLPTAEDRAGSEVERLLKLETKPVLRHEVVKELDHLMTLQIQRAGGEGLPIL